MATFATFAPQQVADPIRRMERKIGAAKQAFACLPRVDFYDQLFVILHRPGTSTAAENLFFEAAIDSLTLQSQQLAQLHQQILAAANAIQRDR